MNAKSDKRSFQKLIEHHPDLICQYRKDGTLTYVNTAYCDFFGKTKQQLIGESHYNGIYPEDLENLREHINKFNNNHSHQIIELRCINANSRTHWFQWADYYYYNENVNQWEIQSTGREITNLKQAEFELEQRITFGRLVANLSINFINAPPDDIDEHINHVLAEIGSFLDVDRSYVFLLNHDENTINNTHEWCNEGIEPQIDQLQNINCETLPWWMPKLMNFETIHIPNVSQLPPEAEAEKRIFLAQNIQSMLNIPLVNAGTLLGFIGFDSVKNRKNWTNEEQTILRIVGGIVGSAMIQKQHLEKTNFRVDFFEKLNKLTFDSLNASSVKEMLDIVANQTADLIGAEGCYITLWDEKNKRVIPSAASQHLSEEYADHTVDSNELSMTASVLSAGHALVAEDVHDSPYISERAAKLFPTKSLLGVPMITDGKKLGAMLLAYQKKHHFTDEEITLANYAASQIVQALFKLRLLEKTRKSAKKAETLHKAGAIVASTLKPDLAIELILDQLERVVPFDTASVQILEEGYLEIKAGKGWPPGFDPTGIRFNIPGNNPNTMVIQSQKPYVLNDAPENFLIFSNNNFKALNIRSWLGVPLIVHDEVIGMLTLDHHQEGFYDDEYLIDLVTAFADQVAISLENARLYAREHQRFLELDALRATTADITRELGLENLLKAILIRATALLNATGGELGLLDSNGETIQILVNHNMGSENSVNSIQSGEGLMGYVVQTKQIEMIENYQDWEGRLDTYKENPIHAAIAAPLMIGERLLGVIGIMNSDRNRTFSSSDKDLMHLFAQQAAIAVENAQLFEEKERQARVDITTNIYNRRGLLELGKRELDRAHRYERPLAAMMIDIDRFKRVNDSHGHAIGDLVLKELAHLLESNIRTIDILGRYGGEEFVILLPETSPESAYEIAERLRKKVSDHTFKPESLKLHITISIGLAFSSGENNGLQDLIRRADDAMYRSKGAGRNLSSFYKSS